MRDTQRISAIFKIVNAHRLMNITEKECKEELRKLSARHAINCTCYNDVEAFVKSETTDYSGFTGAIPKNSIPRWMRGIRW